MTQTRNRLNENDIRAQKNLRKIWNAVKADCQMNQTDFAEDVLGWTQGNFSQYLTGKIRIGDKALEKLCIAFKCNPWDIREELCDSKLTMEHSIYQDLYTNLQSMKDSSAILPPEIEALLEATTLELEAFHNSQTDQSEKIAA